MTPVKNRHDKFGAFDIETHGFNGECEFISWAWETKVNGKIEQRTATKIEVFLDYVIKNTKLNEVIWYAHNGGFDMARASDYLIELIEQNYIIDIIESGENNIAALTITKDEVVVFKYRDSMKIYQGSLAEFSKQFGNGITKLENIIDFEGGELFDINNKSHVDYAKQDTLALLNSVINFERRLLADFSINLRMTSASCAMQAWRTTIPYKTKYERLPEAIENFARQCYYGGYVYMGENARQKVNRAYHLDISSSYPAAMLDFGVPYGNPIEVTDYEPGDIGLYEVEILNADGLTIAPMRTKTGVAWPRGSFKTFLTSIDLVNLDENKTDYKIISGYRFPSIIFPFNTFISSCREYRQLYKGTGGETTAKLMQNSLYGKFGAKPEITKISYHKNDLGQFGFIDEEIDFDFSETKKLDDYANRTIEKITATYLLPHWAAFITAAARLRLHRTIRTVEFKNFLYADTDSIVCNSQGYQNLLLRTPEILGSDYGQFQLEKIWDSFRVHAPKVYAGKKLNKMFNVEHTGRAKGVPKKHRTDEFFNKLLNENQTYEAMKYESVSSLKSVFNGNEYAIERKRTLSKIENSKNWVIENNKVRPIKC